MERLGDLVNTFLSSAQQALKDQYHAYVQANVAPVVAALESDNSGLKDLLSKLGQSGYLGITVPKEYGGQGGTFTNLLSFAECLGEVDAGLGLCLAGHTAVVEMILRYGSETQKSRYLPLLARGECIGAFALTEVNAGSDFKAAQTKAIGKDSSIKISGTKTWVVNGAIAGLYLVLSRHLEEAKDGDTGRLMLTLVDSGASSIKPSADRKKLGLRSANTSDVEFVDHPTSLEAALKAADDAACEAQVNYGLDIAKSIVSATAIGLTQEALNLSVERARTREQFGGPISQFQGIQWKLADHSADLAAARMLTLRAGWAKDESPEDLAKFAAMCKFFAAKTARVHSSEAIQVFGALGISEETPLERMYRDAKVLEICEGTSEYQKVILVKELGVV